MLTIASVKSRIISRAQQLYFQFDGSNQEKTESYLQELEQLYHLHSDLEMVANYYLRMLYQSTLRWHPDSWFVEAERATKIHQQHPSWNMAAFLTARFLAMTDQSTGEDIRQSIQSVFLTNKPKNYKYLVDLARGLSSQANDQQDKERKASLLVVEALRSVYPESAELIAIQAELLRISASFSDEEIARDYIRSLSCLVSEHSENTKAAECYVAALSRYMERLDFPATQAIAEEISRIGRLYPSHAYIAYLQAKSLTRQLQNCTPAREKALLHEIEQLREQYPQDEKITDKLIEALSLLAQRQDIKGCQEHCRQIAILLKEQLNGSRAEYWSEALVALAAHQDCEEAAETLKMLRNLALQYTNSYNTNCMRCYVRAFLTWCENLEPSRKAYEHRKLKRFLTSYDFDYDLEPLLKQEQEEHQNRLQYQQRLDTCLNLLQEAIQNRGASQTAQAQLYDDCRSACSLLLALPAQPELKRLLRFLESIPLAPEGASAHQLSLSMDNLIKQCSIRAISILTQEEASPYLTRLQNDYSSHRDTDSLHLYAQGLKEQLSVQQRQVDSLDLLRELQAENPGSPVLARIFAEALLIGTQNYGLLEQQGERIASDLYQLYRQHPQDETIAIFCGEYILERIGALDSPSSEEYLQKLWKIVNAFPCCQKLAETYAVAATQHHWHHSSPYLLPEQLLADLAELCQRFPKNHKTAEELSWLYNDLLLHSDNVDYEWLYRMQRQLHLRYPDNENIGLFFNYIVRSLLQQHQQAGQEYTALLAEWQRLCDAFPVQIRILQDYLQELDKLDSPKLIPEGCRLFARALEVQPDHLGLARCYAHYLRSSIKQEDQDAESKLSRLYEEYAEYRGLLNNEDDMPETEDVDEA